MCRHSVLATLGACGDTAGSMDGHGDGAMSAAAGKLFRAEALHAQQQRWLGELRLVTPLSTRVLVGGIALIVAVLAVFASLGTYTRRVHATGMLAPATGLLTLAAPTAGRLQRIAIREGAPVAAGQVLAIVSSERQSLAGNTSSAVLSQLAMQRTRLGSEIADAEQLAVQQRSGLAQRMALLRAQLHSLEQQRLLAREQAAQSAALLARIAPLGDKGYVSAFEIARQRSAKLEAESQVKALDRQLIELRQQLAATQDQSAQLPLNLASQRSGLQRQRAGIEQALAQAEAERAAVIRAPRTGRVTSVLAVEGQPVVAGQALLALVPDGVPLEAELLIPSAAAGFVRVGQRVALRYAAFPYQKFGLQGGRVRQISQSALSQVEISTLLGGQAPPTALYRVRIVLDAQRVIAYGAAQALKPGMALEADLLLERRRLLEWVFEPLYGFTRRLPERAP